MLPGGSSDDHRPAGRHHLARPDNRSAGPCRSTGLNTLRRASRVCAELSRACAVRSAASASSSAFCVPAHGLEQRLRAIDRPAARWSPRPRACATSACCSSASTREQRRAGLDLIALAHRERLDAAGLVGADEDQIGLDPALEAAHVGRLRSRRARAAPPAAQAMPARVHGRSLVAEAACRNARASSRARRAARSGRTVRSR